MHRVIVRNNAHYREQGGEYHEACVRCGERRGTADTCSCGAEYPPTPKKFFILRREPPSMALQFPDTCPHCDGEVTKTLSVFRELHTSRRSRARVTFHVPMCKRMLHPSFYYITYLIAIFVAIIAGLVATGPAIKGEFVPAPWIVLVATVAGCVWLWRRFTWIRLVDWGQGAVAFKIRRDDYAKALARLNHGYVKGRLRKP